MDRTIGKSQNRNYDGERLMKILESYKKIMNELLKEANLGVNPYGQGKEPKPGDWWKSSEGADYAMGKDGDRQGPFNDEKDAEAYAKGELGQDTSPDDDSEDDAGSIKGDPSEFERGGDEPKADKQEPDYAGSIEDDEEAGQWANDLAQGAEPRQAHQKLTDMGHGDLADDLMRADSPEEKARIVAKATGQDYEPYEETININGKKYREVKEDRADGKKLVGYSFAGKMYKNKDDAPVSDPTPVYESKKSKKHILKENYERFFGDK